MLPEYFTVAACFHRFFVKLTHELSFFYVHAKILYVRDTYAVDSNEYIAETTCMAGIDIFLQSLEEGLVDEDQLNSFVQELI